MLTFAKSNLILAADCDQIYCDKNTQDEDTYLRCNKEKQSCWEGKINEARGAKVTLSNTISILNGQIQVQQLKINQTESEVGKLESEIQVLLGRIEGLDLSLDQLSEVLVKRVTENYKQSHTNPLMLIVSQGRLGEFLKQWKYLKLTEQQTASAMERAESQRLDYDNQKTLKEEKQQELEAKQKELESQRLVLDKQKGEQEYLLKETQNNEAKYQAELAKTLAELEAIQSIIAGNGNESEVRSVNEGDQIASIIAGASACSTGTHLHFEVVKDSSHRDPAGYLRSIDAEWSNSPDSAFGFGGSWNWPMNNPARITQGYGMTYYARVKRAYGGAPHTGMDMVSKTYGDYTVKAVKSGKLYRGSIPCGGGLLRYVRVEHQEEGISTYYLHVNY